MKKNISLTLAFLLLPAVLFAQQVVQDATYKMGKLPNGLTYYIRQNTKEAGIADFYIAQKVGSILEEPRQRGLAHFLEHMAFNGTKHFRGDASSPGIVPWCESIGVRFGTNLNAYTGVEQTVYNVSAVPVKRNSVVDSTLLILHDWSNCLLLTDKEIDKERGVVHEEWRTRRAGMAIQRMMERAMPAIYKGTKYEDCLPIGSMDIVDNFPYNDLRDYYHKWYRPDLQAIVVVGDINVNEIEAKIKRIFADIPAPKNPAKRVYYPVSNNKDMIVAIEKDAEQPLMLANLYMKHEATPDAERATEQYQRDNYITELIEYMLNGRLGELKQQKNPPLHSATAHVGSFLISRTKDAFSLSFGCLQENIQGSFDAAIGAVERARRHGFTASELQRAKAIQAKIAQRRFAEQGDRRNNYFVNRAVRHFLEAEPMLDAGYEKQLIDGFGTSVTLQEVNNAARELISDENQVLVIYAPDKPDFHLPDAQTLKGYVLAAQAKQYAPYTEKALPTRLLPQEPKPGSIKSETDWGRFGAKKLVLSNGVEVYVKPTTFSKDRVSMRFYGEGGTSRYPDKDAANFNMLPKVVEDAGIGSFTKTELGKVLASKIVRVAPVIGEETQAINGSSSVNDLETMLQLTRLYFTSPRKDRQAFEATMATTRSFLKNREASPQVTFNDSVMNIVYGKHPRIRPMDLNRLQEVNFDRIYQIYQDRFSDASGFKMVLVGNVDMAVLRPLLCKYIASLPAMGRRETFNGGLPQVVGGSRTHLFKKKTSTPSALVNVFYTFDEPYSAQKDLALDVFKRVLSIAYTDSVREEKGGTYGVSVQASLDKFSVPTALLKLSFRTDPAKYAQLMPIVYRQIEHIAQAGPLPSSMDKAKKYLEKAYRQNIVDNGYWDYTIYNYLRTGVDFDTDYLQLLNRLSADDVRKVAQDLLNAHRRIEVTMLSE